MFVLRCTCMIWTGLRARESNEHWRIDRFSEFSASQDSCSQRLPVIRVYSPWGRHIKHTVDANKKQFVDGNLNVRNIDCEFNQRYSEWQKEMVVSSC